MKLHRRVFFLLISLAIPLTIGRASVSAQNEPYLNPALSVEQRVEDLLGRMTLEEKIGQMTLIEKNSISPQAVAQYAIGGVLSGGGGYPTPNTPENWAQMVAAFQEAALSTRLSIPIIYGVDAVHGHGNVYGATIFPHNVGLGATRNPDLVEQIGRATALEMAATNIVWNYAPVVAVPQDIRWGRAYEAFSENTELVTELGLAFMRGLQGDDLSAPASALATVKHFVGDGGAAWGTSPFGPNNIDRGITQGDEAFLRAVHLPPYVAAVDAGARSIMISFTSWDGLPMHAHRYLITEVLKGELGFDGFTVSDWGGVDEVAPDYDQAVVTSINGGIDMVMVPQDYQRFIASLTRAVEQGDVSQERIDDAVRRILRVKFELGLFERPLGNEALLATVGSDAHRALAREAVSQSLVLLKNDNQTLPITRDSATIFVAGQAADDIGIQSGGWTIEWQGSPGNITSGTTILEGIEAIAGAAAVHYDSSGRFGDLTDSSGNPLVADVGIVVVGEQPYAEWEGDDPLLNLSSADEEMIQRVRQQSEQLVVVLISGRPLIIENVLKTADAFVAAWLPGTEGQGVADVLFGDKPFTGRLPFTWPRTIEQLPFDFANLPAEGCDAPLFPFGYGLDAANTDSPYLLLAAQCATGLPETPVARTGSVPPPSDVLLAPEGIYGETYLAPFPVSIALDGDFDDWAGVPRVTVPQDADVSSGQPAVTFAAAADDQYLYFFADVVDNNIISGEHGEDYWNEDSVEFYVNATGDLELTEYTEGVAQITIPALNMYRSPDDAIISGVQGTSADALVVVVRTPTGYAVEAAVPLQNAVWDITPTHEGVIGFQVHLNGASASNRDTKLIWSVFDTSDQSYFNPSVFGQLIFYDISQAAG